MKFTEIPLGQQAEFYANIMVNNRPWPAGNYACLPMLEAHYEGLKGEEKKKAVEHVSMFWKEENR